MIKTLFDAKQEQLKVVIRGYIVDETTVRNIAQTVWTKLGKARNNGDLYSPEHAERLMHSIVLRLIMTELRLDEPRTPEDVLVDLGYDGDVLELLAVVRNMPSDKRSIFDGLCGGKTFAEIGTAQGVSANCIGLRWSRYCRNTMERNAVAI